MRCLDREHRAYFNTLYAGTTQVIVDLCQEGSYQSGKYINLKVLKLIKLFCTPPQSISLMFLLIYTDYLRHAPCMRQVQSGYERCASEYQQRIKSLNSGAGGILNWVSVINSEF